MDEQIVYLYHLGIDWLAKSSLLSLAEIAQLRERLKVEAARVQDEDSIALRILANALEPYQQD